jgi:hypothetical protein
MFETEYKDEKQLKEIKEQIEAKANTVIREIRYNRSLYDADEDFITAVTIDRIGFFIAPYKNKEMLEKEINSICKEIKKEIKDRETKLFKIGR